MPRLSAGRSSRCCDPQTRRAESEGSMYKGDYDGLGPLGLKKGLRAAMALRVPGLRRLQMGVRALGFDS